MLFENVTERDITLITIESFVCEMWAIIHYTNIYKL